MGSVLNKSRSLVTVACFLIGRAKDLSADPRIRCFAFDMCIMSLVIFNGFILSFSSVTDAIQFMQFVYLQPFLGLLVST